MKNLSMWEMFLLRKSGVKFYKRSIADLKLHRLNIKNPSELVGNNPIIQKVIEKHWEEMIVPKLKRK